MSYYHATDFATMTPVIDCDITDKDFLVVETTKNIDNLMTYQQFSTFKYIDMHNGKADKMFHDCIYKVTFRGDI